MADKKDAPAEDVMKETGSFDHETNTLNEPAKSDDPKVMRHDVDPNMDQSRYAEEDAPIPRRGDPFAHQRDEKAAAKASKEEQKNDKEVKKARDES